jgi:hypothetical protein
MKLSDHMLNAAKVRAMISFVMSEYRAECERAAPHVLKLEKRLSDNLNALCAEPPPTEEEQVVAHIKRKRHGKEQKQERERRAVKEWSELDRDRSPNDKMLDAFKKK